jgi:hypothetical protein
MTNIKSSLNLFENHGHKRYVCYPTLRMKLNVISKFSLVVLWNVLDYKKPSKSFMHTDCTLWTIHCDLFDSVHINAFLCLVYTFPTQGTMQCTGQREGKYR